ncbi:MAG: glycosyltransferase WbuB, partial [Nitrososphaerales archaeon]
MVARADRPAVLIIVQNLPVPFDRRVWLECKALTASGYRVSVVCPGG